MERLANIWHSECFKEYSRNQPNEPTTIEPYPELCKNYTVMRVIFEPRNERPKLRFTGDIKIDNVIRKIHKNDNKGLRRKLNRLLNNQYKRK